MLYDSLPHLYKLASLGLANRANPIGRQILECRVGGYPALNVTKLRVIYPLANRATVFLHLFHVVRILGVNTGYLVENF